MYSTFSSKVQSFRNKIKEQKAQAAGSYTPLIPVAAVNISFTQPGLELVSWAYRHYLGGVRRV